MAQRDEWGGIAVEEKPPASTGDDWGGIPVQSQKPDEWGGIPVAPSPSTPDATAATPHTFEQRSQDRDFDATAHAAQNPDDFEKAFQFQQARKARPLTAKVGEGIAAIPGAVPGAVKGVWNFLSGFPQVALNSAQQAYYGVTGDPRAQTKQAEATLTAQHGEEAGKSLIDKTVGNIAAAAGKMDDPDPARTQWRESILRRNPTRRTPAQLDELKATWAAQDAQEKKVRDEDIDRRVFQMRVEAAKNAQQLAQGRPLETGGIAKLYELGNQNITQEVGPEALTAAGAPQADLGNVERMSAATDPNNVLLSMAPNLTGAAKIGGAVTEAAGKAMQLPGKAISGLTSPLTKAADLINTAINPIGAATKAAKKGGAKGLQAIGEALESQGKELRTGAPSPLTTKAATAAATGESAIGTNIARKAGDVTARGAQTAAGMAPLNLALSEGDPKEFANLEVGAAAFGGGIGGFQRNRAALVEGARPHLRSEGARALAEAGEGNDPLAQRSAAYVMSLPEEARDRTLEAIGALQGLPLNTKDGKARAKLYVLNESDYTDAVNRIVGEKAAAMGGGRGFFNGPDGAAYVNGDYHSGLGPGELAHTVGHEFGGHAAINVMRAAGEQGGALYQGMMNSAREALLPGGKVTPEFKTFVDEYNKAFDPSGQTQRLDPNNRESIEEFLAETAGQIMESGAADLAIPRNIQDKISDGIGRFMGSLVGLDTRKVGTDTKFGREESGKVTQTVRDALAQLVGMKLRDGAELPEAPKTDTTRIAELQQIMGTPRPRPGSPVEQVQQWLQTRRAAERELRDLQTDAAAPFPASGTPPVPPSAPSAPTAPRSRVAAALRTQGIPAAEAQQWAARAQGATFEEMVVDALRQRAGQKFPTQTPGTPETATVNTPEVLPQKANTPTNEPTGETTPTPDQPLPQGPTVGVQEPPTPIPPTPGIERPSVPAPSREAVASLVANAEAQAVAAEKNPNTKAAQIRIHKAKVDAILDAIGDDPTGIHRVEQPDGTVTRVGNLDPNNPYHQALVDLSGGIEPHALDALLKMQDAKDQVRHIRYRSALSSAEGEGGEGTMDTGMTNRHAEYANDPAATREEGTIQHKVIIPVQTKVTAGGRPQSTFFVLDNLLHNAESLREFMRANPGAAGAFPYTDEGTLVRDAKVYADNHTHGWKGDGSAPIKQFPDSNLPRPDLNYQAEKIPKERFDALNLLMHSEDAGKYFDRIQEVQEKEQKLHAAKTDKERTRLQGVLDRSITRMKTSEEAHNLAAENNPWIDQNTGETNELRAKLKAAGFDTKDALKSPFETLDPKHILDVSESPIAMQEGDVPTVRPTGFTSGAETMAPMRRLNPKAVSAAFLP